VDLLLDTTGQGLGRTQRQRQQQPALEHCSEAQLQAWSTDRRPTSDVRRAALESASYMYGDPTKTGNSDISLGLRNKVKDKVRVRVGD